MISSRRWGRTAVTAGMLTALVAAPVGALAIQTAPPLARTDAGGGNGLPQPTIEFRKVTESITSGGTFTIVSSSALAGQKPRIIHLSNGTTKLDRCEIATATGGEDTLTPTDCTIAAHQGTGAHTWAIEAVAGGYTIKSKTAGGTYINITANGAAAGADSQVLSIESTGNGSFTISRDVDGTKRYLTYDTTSAATGWTSSTTAYPVYLYQETEVPPEIVPNGKAETGTAQDRPFAPNTGNSANFRIPSLITLKDGSLLASIDARWNVLHDAGGLDTILSRSTDGGSTWTYRFPNYFNDTTDAYNNRGTAFIDPVMVQTTDGTIYMMVDLWPGGVALNRAANNHPVNSSGYVRIGDTYRLALYSSPNPDVQRTAGAETGAGYTHYVGDFDDDGFAPVIDASSGDTTGYVDRQYYLFDTDKQPTYCQQLGSSKYVQQNVFYYNANLHVTATSYLWLTTSTDNGETWSDPLMLNEQVRTGRDSNDCFYGVGPGRGLVTSSGRIVFPCYTYKYGHGDGNTSVIYSDDGETWHRSEDIDRQTSEATVVEADGRLYLFARHGVMAVSNDNGETWENEQSIAGIDIHIGCQLDAVTYSQRIDGKTAILLSCPTGSGRVNGTIFVGLVQDDGSIDWAYRHAVTTGGGAFAYSCLTEREDGSVALLYEGPSSESMFETFDIAEIAPGATIGNDCQVNVPLYGTVAKTVSGTLSGFEDIDRSIVDISVVENSNGSSTVTFTGKKEGTVSFTDPDSGVSYTITVAPRELAEVTLDDDGETVIDVTGSTIDIEPDPKIATAEIKTVSYTEALGEASGSLHSGSAFTGEVIGMSKALHTFSKSGDDWTISGTTAGGQTSYLNLSQDTVGYPGNTQQATIQITAASEAEDAFKLYDTVNRRYLHFFRSGEKLATFDRCQNSCGAADAFEIWQRTQARSADDSPIPGYTQVTSLDQLENDGSYLIVANVDGTRYALNPSTSTTDKYAHVVKIDPERTKTQLTVTGVGVGTTDVVVDGIVYRIKVDGYLDPTFTWSEDGLTATATFQHSGSGETKQVACTVETETVAATCTEDGMRTSTATVELDGKTFTDTNAIALPATGHQDVAHVPAKEPTTTASGNREHWVCQLCKVIFLDEALTKPGTAKDVTIPPVEATKTHRVTFVDGLPGTKDAVVTVEDGDTVARPTDPAYEGWTFAGWFLDATFADPYDFSQPVTGDLKLYGGWRKQQPEDPEHPTKPEKPEGPTEIGTPEPNRPNLGAGDTGGRETGLPTTGDAASAIGIVTALGAAIAGAGLELKRRRK